MNIHVEPIEPGSREDLFSRANPACEGCDGRGRLAGSVDRWFPCPCTFEAWEAHFWNRVDMSRGLESCWPWLGADHGKGYGYTRWPARKRNELTHRIAYTLAYGEPVLPVIRHQCDNKPCCNPRHLLEGTTQDNVDDAKERGLLADPTLTKHVGERNARAKLTEADIDTIVERAQQGANDYEQAQVFGVVPATITAIIGGQSWKHRNNGARLLPRRRSPRNGVNNGRAVLSPVGIAAIRERYSASGVLQRELAAEFGVTQSHISSIVRGEAWS